MNSEIDNILSSIDFENIEKHPNILIAASFWDRDRYRAAQVCYKFMRMIDDLIDERRSRDDTIASMEKQMLTEKVNTWLGCLENSTDHDPFIEELKDTISIYKIPLQLLHNFARSMLYDINHNTFPSFRKFLDYAEGASVAPASVFVHLCCLSKENGHYKPSGLDVVRVARPCAIFSYIVHIIRDFQEDQRSNLNYFATDILERNHLRPADLKDIANGETVPDSFRNVIREYYSHAEKYRDQTLIEIQNLEPQVNGRYLLSLHVIYNLYKQVFDRIDVDNGQFTTGELNPGMAEIREKVMEIASRWK